jgi:hypothetical protein
VKVGAVYFCNICAAEIPDGESVNEFDCALLATKGHCHGDCLTQRNAILDQYERLSRGLTALLDPGIQSAQKIHQAMVVEGRTGRPLKRADKKIPGTPQVPRGMSLGKRPRTTANSKVKVHRTKGRQRRA